MGLQMQTDPPGNNSLLRVYVRTMLNKI